MLTCSCLAGVTFYFSGIRGEVRGITKVRKMHPLGIMNVCRNFHSIPSNSCWDKWWASTDQRPLFTQGDLKDTFWYFNFQDQSPCVLYCKASLSSISSAHRLSEKKGKQGQSENECVHILHMCVFVLCMFVKGYPVENSRHNRLFPAGLCLSVTAWLTSYLHLLSRARTYTHTHKKKITNQHTSGVTSRGNAGARAQPHCKSFRLISHLFSIFRYVTARMPTSYQYQATQRKAFIHKCTCSKRCRH